jgi:N-acetylmuramoyl-L-alanine amidase
MTSAARTAGWVAGAVLFGTLLVAAPPSGPAAAARRHLDRPRIRDDRIPYGAARKREMAGYSKRHYGHRTWRLRHTKLIVLHFTDGPTWRSARSTFASNAPSLGELPGDCSHYIVDKRGHIHEIVPPRIRCRHTIGVNYTAIGVEMVQEAPNGSHDADLRILHRKRQVRAALRLVDFLRLKLGLPVNHVIGHAMANRSRYFRDLEGWRNDHTDWLWRDVRVFRRRLHRL